MSLSSKLYLSTYNAKTEEQFGAKRSSKTSRMTKLWQFLQRHPRHAFSEKVQRGHQGKFFKYRPKSSPCLKGTKALWRKLNYSLNKMHLKCKRLENIFAQTAALKVYEWASYGNYRKVTQNQHFLKKCKGGTMRNF